MRYFKFRHPITRRMIYTIRNRISEARRYDMTLEDYGSMYLHKLLKVKI